MINKAIIVGNLGRDAELRVLDSGKNMLTFSVATNESYKKNEEWVTITEWHDIVMFGDNLEYLSDLKKGGLVYVEGKSTTRTYEDQEGNTRYQRQVVAKVIRRLEKKEAIPQANTAMEVSGTLDNDNDLPF